MADKEYSRPVPGTLYHRIAKDFKPKEADMMICRHIEELEARLAAIEGLEARLEAVEKQLAEKATSKKKGSDGNG
jgi:hypothetical protein